PATRSAGTGENQEGTGRRKPPRPWRSPGRRAPTRRRSGAIAGVRWPRGSTDRGSWDRLQEFARVAGQGNSLQENTIPNWLEGGPQGCFLLALEIRCAYCVASSGKVQVECREHLLSRNQGCERPTHAYGLAAGHPFDTDKFAADCHAGIPF